MSTINKDHDDDDDDDGDDDDRATATWFNIHSFGFMAPDLWLLNSSDINPVDCRLWSVM